ncbi:MAG: hypothetical protein ACFFB0_10240 [Promethearchaeota archaeon]
MSSNHYIKQFKMKTSNIRDKQIFERIYYKELGKCLKIGQIKNFKKLFSASIDFDIFIDVKKINRRFEFISKLLMNFTDKISTEYRTSALGDQIDILRFCNEYGLLEKELTEAEKNSIKKIKKDKLLLANLNDLYGQVSDSFLYYVYFNFPRELYKHIISRPNLNFQDKDALIHYIKNNFFNQYTIYGLSVRYLSSIRRFIDIFNKNFNFLKNEEAKEKVNLYNNSKEFMEFNVIYRTFYYGIEENREFREIKKHLVSPENIIKNIDNILKSNNYKFYSISMVLLGGLGPQGLGFTYSTPKGEIIEICSDQKETEAIIIKFKQYLKRKFLSKLENELVNFKIDIDIRNKIIEFLSEILNPEELVNYYDKNSILKKIKKFLNNIEEFQQDYKIELEEIIRKISQAISIIFRRIKLKDQFMARMDLVAKNKIKSEDIAKLTSLRGKSHYDVLRERFFFQYIVDWVYDIYSVEQKIGT